MGIYLDDITKLPERVQLLLQAAHDVAPRAYNRYSHFLVGAAVESRTGSIYVGTFMENASYGMTICAEPAALLAANSAGDRVINALAVVGGPSRGGSQGDVVTPCGRCRQIYLEATDIAGRDIEIYCGNADLSRILVATVYELLPYAFGPAATRNTE